MPTLKDLSILIHTGLNDSGPDPWHSHWEQAFPDFVGVGQNGSDHCKLLIQKTKSENSVVNESELECAQLLICKIKF